MNDEQKNQDIDQNYDFYFSEFNAKRAVKNETYESETLVNLLCHAMATWSNVLEVTDSNGP